MSVTTGMVGHGFYNRNSAPQWATIEAVLPWLEDAIADMPLSAEPGPVALADFGCSEGGNSVEVMRRLVGALRRRTSRPIQTIHSDLPTNDYRWLLRHLREGGRSALGEDVFSAVVGGSMFDQLLPPRSLHVATTFNAIGFLSRKPVERLPGYILPNGPSALRGVGRVDPDDQATFAAQALSDVESFLRDRAAELVPGGKLLIGVFGAGPPGRTCDGIYDALNDAVLEALDAGLIDRADYEAYYQPVYFRALDELTAPLTSPDAPLAAQDVPSAPSDAPLVALFRLERAECYEVEVPFVEEFRRTGDVATYARSYTDFFRAFTEPVLRAAFPEPDRLAADVFARAERLVREHPERYEFHYVSVAALLTRLEG
jgi:gibberellin A4 carboxyl methyltransferase